MQKIYTFLRNGKYDFLLFALLMHLFNVVFFKELDFYTDWVWPVNVPAGYGRLCDIFRAEQGIKMAKKHSFYSDNVTAVLTIIKHKPSVEIRTVLNFVYVAFYCVIFVEVLRFLSRPSYINTDIIIAAICGYLLLIEIGIFSLQYIYDAIPGSFLNVNNTTNTTVLQTWFTIAALRGPV